MTKPLHAMSAAIDYILCKIEGVFKSSLQVFIDNTRVVRLAQTISEFSITESEVLERVNLRIDVSLFSTVTLRKVVAAHLSISLTSAITTSS